MNDFLKLEAELKKLRPAAVSADLSVRVEAELYAERSGALAESFSVVPRGPSTAPAAPVAMTGARGLARNWLPLGLGLAAAAVFLLLARGSFEHAPTTRPTVANAELPRVMPATADSLIPAGLTQVVYSTRDEGLVFANGTDRPVRRVRSRKLETMHWHNPDTGASLRVSYPREEVEFVPVSGQ